MTKTPALLDSENSLLLIVDIQTRLTRVMSEKALEAMLSNTQRLIQAANLLDIPTLVTEQYPKGLGSTVESVSDALNDNSVIIEKTGFSCCAADRFMSALQKTARKQIIIAGQETHVCVLQTALDLIELGFQVHIVEDAVCSRKAEHKTHALQRMQQHGAIISNFESVIFECLKDSGHEHFSTISKLLR